jgi:excisionase family DNA binding protein
MAADRDLDLITLKEAAQLLRVSEVTVRRWLKQGRLRAYHVGPRAVRLRRADIERALHSIGPADESTSSRRYGAIYVTEPRPLTDEERRRAREVLQAMRDSIEEQRRARGDVPFDESWPLINASRDERSRQLW